MLKVADCKFFALANLQLSTCNLQQQIWLRLHRAGGILRIMFFPPQRFPPLGPARLSPRERALAAWRGIDLSASETARQSRVKSAGAIMTRLLSDLRIDTRRAEAEIVKVWNNLLDPETVAHAQPVGLRKGTLFVNVDSSVWLAEIVRYRRKEILDRLQHSFGRDLIARISFRIG
jgi:hypothetical protein